MLSPRKICLSNSLHTPQEETGTQGTKARWCKMFVLDSSILCGFSCKNFNRDVKWYEWYGVKQEEMISHSEEPGQVTAQRCSARGYFEAQRTLGSVWRCLTPSLQLLLVLLCRTTLAWPQTGHTCLPFHSLFFLSGTLSFMPSKTCSFLKTSIRGWGIRFSVRILALGP